MTELQAALLEMTAFLDERRVPYMVIGGFANLEWGRVRLTRDLDLTVEVPEAAIPGFLKELGRRFPMRVADAEEWLRLSHLVPLVTRNGIPVDLMFAVLPYQVAAIRRAVAITVGAAQVRLCSAEDLIVHKLASERLQDASDVEGIILKQRESLDRGYLDARVRELAAGLERPSILRFYRDCLHQAGLPPSA